MLVSTVRMGCIGFLDDYRKLKYHNKEGLKGKYKITGQVGLGLIVGLTMWLSPSVVMRENAEVVNERSNEIEVVHMPSPKSRRRPRFPSSRTTTSTMNGSPDGSATRRPPGRSDG